MNYETFIESNSHNRRNFEHVLNLLRNRVDKIPAFTLFLGAGASITSGVRAASSMMEEWRRLLFSSDRTEEPFEEWLKKQEWFEVEDEYSHLFELVYDQASQRRAYIENIVKEGKPSWGYAYLTSFVERGIINTVFTTNFDDLINESCFQFSQDLRPLVCAHDSAVNSIRISSERPKVIKLHGDFLYDSIKNTSTELQSLESNMREKFMEFAREFGLIVLGYSGTDKSVMDVLDLLARSPNYFKNGLYWCIKKGSTPGTRLRQLLRNDRVYWVEIDGFDDFMASAADSLSIGLPKGVTDPHLVALERTLHLINDDSASFHPLILHEKGRTSEVYERICQGLKDVGLGDVKSVSQSKDKKFGALADLLEKEALPIFQGRRALEEKNYSLAETHYKKMLEASDTKNYWHSLRGMLDSMLYLGTRHTELSTILRSHVDWKGNSGHFSRLAHYALFINEGGIALEFCEKALKLNPGSYLALLNRGLAYLQLEDFVNLEKDAFTLTSERMGQQQYRAAGFAMLGEVDAMIISLQRSFALHQYDPESACKDVAFRPYWENPRFLQGLSQFFGKKNPEVPFLKVYPMTRAEESLRKRVT